MNMKYRYKAIKEFGMRNRRKRNLHDKNRMIRWLLLLLVGIFCAKMLSENLSGNKQEVSLEHKHSVFFEGVIDGIEGMTGAFVKELIPMKVVLDGETKSYKDSILTWIAKEFLPGAQFQWGYEAQETLVVDNQDYLYLMEENEDENQEEMQQTELQLVTKKETETKTTKKTTEDKTDTKTASTEVGKTYTKSQLYSTQFLLENFYIVESTARLLPSEINGKTLLNKDLTISTDGNKPKILIYHTHASEAYQDSKAGKQEDTVVGVGSYLTKLLEEKYQISVYHDKTVYDIIDGKLDRSRAYNMALVGIQKILKENPSIEVVIDLHRDGVNKGTRLVTTVNGKKTAKMMFMNGISRSAKNGDISYLYNPNKESNLAFTLQLQLDAAKKYPDLMRKIYVKTYRYNLHVKPRSMLVEVGANTNTVQEAKNAMIPLSEMLSDILIEE